ncbi:hypothetical protein ER70_01060 [Borreliella bissettiae]|uniref:Uncharacterized protein n=1 Tax=Borrelia bissettiae TaxID=64897 RepID=A0A1L8ZD68_BORBI|nr:hypothetical protein ER70_01060 [Borreliella bissettiae]
MYILGGGFIISFILYFVFCMGFFGCGLDNILILPSPEKVDNRISRDSVSFFYQQVIFPIKQLVN